MTACRELEVDFGLRNGADTERRNPKAELRKVDTPLGDVRHQVGNTLKAVLKLSFPNLRGIQCAAFHAQHRGETDQGRIQRYTIYRYCLFGHG